MNFKTLFKGRLDVGFDWTDGLEYRRPSCNSVTPGRLAAGFGARCVKWLGATLKPDVEAAKFDMPGCMGWELHVGMNKVSLAFEKEARSLIIHTDQDTLNPIQATGLGFITIDGYVLLDISSLSQVSSLRGLDVTRCPNLAAEQVAAVVASNSGLGCLFSKYSREELLAVNSSMEGLLEGVIVNGKTSQGESGERTSEMVSPWPQSAPPRALEPKPKSRKPAALRHASCGRRLPRSSPPRPRIRRLSFTGVESFVVGGCAADSAPVRSSGSEGPVEKLKSAVAGLVEHGGRTEANFERLALIVETLVESGKKRDEAIRELAKHAIPSVVCSASGPEIEGGVGVAEGGPAE